MRSESIWIEREPKERRKRKLYVRKWPATRDLVSIPSSCHVSVMRCGGAVKWSLDSDADVNVSVQMVIEVQCTCVMLQLKLIWRLSWSWRSCIDCWRWSWGCSCICSWVQSPTFDAAPRFAFCVDANWRELTRIDTNSSASARALPIKCLGSRAQLLPLHDLESTTTLPYLGKHPPPTITTE